jgi:hypothetical protein
MPEMIAAHGSTEWIKPWARPAHHMPSSTSVIGESDQNGKTPNRSCRTTPDEGAGFRYISDDVLGRGVHSVVTPSFLVLPV